MDFKNLFVSYSSSIQFLPFLPVYNKNKSLFSKLHPCNQQIFRVLKIGFILSIVCLSQCVSAQQLRRNSNNYNNYNNNQNQNVKYNTNQNYNSNYNTNNNSPSFQRQTQNKNTNEEPAQGKGNPGEAQGGYSSNQSPNVKPKSTDSTFQNYPRNDESDSPQNGGQNQNQRYSKSRGQSFQNQNLDPSLNTNTNQQTPVPTGGGYQSKVFDSNSNSNQPDRQRYQNNKLNQQQAPAGGGYQDQSTSQNYDKNQNVSPSQVQRYQNRKQNYNQNSNLNEAPQIPLSSGGYKGEGLDPNYKVSQLPAQRYQNHNSQQQQQVGGYQSPNSGSNRSPNYNQRSDQDHHINETEEFNHQPIAQYRKQKLPYVQPIIQAINFNPQRNTPRQRQQQLQFQSGNTNQRIETPNEGNSFSSPDPSQEFEPRNLMTNYRPNNDVNFQNSNQNGGGYRSENQQLAPPPRGQSGVSGGYGGYQDNQDTSNNGGSGGNGFGNPSSTGEGGGSYVNYTTSRPAISGGGGGGYNYQPQPPLDAPTGSGGYGNNNNYPSGDSGLFGGADKPISSPLPRPTQSGIDAGGNINGKPNQGGGSSSGSGSSGESNPSLQNGAGGSRPTVSSQDQKPIEGGKPTLKPSAPQGQERPEVFEPNQSSNPVTAPSQVPRPRPTEGGGGGYGDKPYVPENQDENSNQGPNHNQNHNNNQNPDQDQSETPNKDPSKPAQGFGKPIRPKPGFEINGETDGSEDDGVDASPAGVTPSKDFLTTTVSPIQGMQNMFLAAWDIRDSIPGQPAEDYPVLSKVPRTNFTCEGRNTGFYADPDTRCQVFHRCTDCAGHTHIIRESFLCPNGTQFNQQILTCDWWANVDCPSSANFFSINDRLSAKNENGSYVELDAHRIPIIPKKEAPTITPREERKPLPAHLQSHHNNQDHHGGHHGSGVGDHHSSSSNPQNIQPTQSVFSSSPATDSHIQIPIVNRTNFNNVASSSNLNPSYPEPLPLTTPPPPLPQPKPSKPSGFVSQDYADYFNDDNPNSNSNSNAQNQASLSRRPNNGNNNNNNRRNNNNDSNRNQNAKFISSNNNNYNNENSNNNNDRNQNVRTSNNNNDNNNNNNYKSERNIDFHSHHHDDIDYHARLLSRIINTGYDGDNFSTTNRIKKRVTYTVNSNSGPEEPTTTPQPSTVNRRRVRNGNNASQRVKPVNNKPFKITGVSYTYTIVAE